MSKQRKYEFTGETKEWGNVTLRQIRAVRAIGLVAAGTIGGWIENEKNLDQVYGNAWVYGNALVYGNARVSGKLKLSKGVLCSIYSFEFSWQVDLWHKMEKDYKIAVDKHLKRDSASGVTRGGGRT